MAQDWARPFYNSKAWQRCRQAYIAHRITVDGGLCERCSKKGKYNLGKEVHHKIWLNPNNINNPEITLSFDNLEYLCETCHTHEHVGKYSPTREGLKFNENGELVKEDTLPPI